MRDEEMTIAIMGIIFGLPAIIAVTSIISGHIAKVVMHWRTTELKARLAQSGMSPADIIELLESGTQAEAKGGWCRKQQLADDELPPKRSAMAGKFS